VNIGFIGFGEAAYELTMGLKEEGLSKNYVYDVLFDPENKDNVLTKRIQSATVIVCQNEKELIEKVDVVFVAVPADYTLAVAKNVAQYLRPGLIYADVSAASPNVKIKVAELVKEKETSFVDVAMMGPLPVYKHKVPILGSGSGIDVFQNIFNQYGMNIKKVSDEAGDASSVKLIRSIFMKGLAGLFIEMLEISHKNNVQNYVIDSISETMDSKEFSYTLNRMVTGTAIHALRRSKELEGSIELLEESNTDSTMSVATKKKLNQIANLNLKEFFDGKTPQNWIEVIEALNRKVGV
jgi:3-hydroxyisobutyrate dehydrogenase-like beta-hydroxyacid dehydrogenase